MKMKRSMFFTLIFTMLLLGLSVKATDSFQNVNFEPISAPTEAIHINSGTTTIYVDPEINEVSPGRNFYIRIEIQDVIDLYGWEFKLGWNITLLDVVGVEEGTFLKAGGDTFFTFKINDTWGYLIADCTLLGSVPGVSGDGTLAIIEFRVKTSGECTLDLYDTILVNSNEQPIPHTAIDGYCISSSNSGSGGNYGGGRKVVW